MQIDETRRDDAPFRVDHVIGVSGQRGGGYLRDDAIFHPHITSPVNPVCRIDDAAAVDQHRCHVVAPFRSHNITLAGSREGDGDT